MARLLLIETATDVCSVGLAVDGNMVSLHEQREGQQHAKLVPLFIQKCLDDTGMKPGRVDAVAVSMGPGSYTGLRIGVAAAKGFCFGTGKPLIAINTLRSMANWFLEHQKSVAGSLLCPMLDARRMEVYLALFSQRLDYEVNVTAEIIDQDFLAKLPANREICFFGSGMPKSKPILETVGNHRFFTDFSPSAHGMVPLAEESFKKQQFEEISAFEPFYLKDFFTPVQPKLSGNRH